MTDWLALPIEVLRRAGLSRGEATALRGVPIFDADWNGMVARNRLFAWEMFEGDNSAEDASALYAYLYPGGTDGGFGVGVGDSYVDLTAGGRFSARPTLITDQVFVTHMATDSEGNWSPFQVFADGEMRWNNIPVIGSPGDVAHNGNQPMARLLPRDRTQDRGGLKLTFGPLEGNVLSMSNVVTADYALHHDQAGQSIDVNSATAKVIVVPLDTVDVTVNIPIGSEYEVARLGAGAVTIAPVSGAVTIHSRGDLLAISARYGVVKLRKLAANEWLLSGDLA